jgi:hypothetical protein
LEFFQKICKFWRVLPTKLRTSFFTGGGSWVVLKWADSSKPIREIEQRYETKRQIDSLAGAAIADLQGSDENGFGYDGAKTAVAPAPRYEAALADLHNVHAVCQATAIYA